MKLSGKDCFVSLWLHRSLEGNIFFVIVRNPKLEREWKMKILIVTAHNSKNRLNNSCCLLKSKLEKIVAYRVYCHKHFGWLCPLVWLDKPSCIIDSLIQLCPLSASCCPPSAAHPDGWLLMCMSCIIKVNIKRKKTFLNIMVYLYTQISKYSGCSTLFRYTVPKTHTLDKYYVGTVCPKIEFNLMQSLECQSVLTAKCLFWVFC